MVSFVSDQSQAVSRESSMWEAYVGEVSQLNVFRFSLEPSEINQLANQSSCNTRYGNAIPWTTFIGWVTGHVTVRNQSHCLGK